MTTLIVALILLVGYFLPTIAAHQRNRQPLVVFVVNLLLGWTLIGWVVALGIALWRDDHAVAQ